MAHYRDANLRFPRRTSLQPFSDLLRKILNREAGRRKTANCRQSNEPIGLNLKRFPIKFFKLRRVNRNLVVQSQIIGQPVWLRVG